MPSKIYCCVQLSTRSSRSTQNTVFRERDSETAQALFHRDRVGEGRQGSARRRQSGGLCGRCFQGGCTEDVWEEGHVQGQRAVPGGLIKGTKPELSPKQTRCAPQFPQAAHWVSGSQISESRSQTSACAQGRGRRRLPGHPTHPPRLSLRRAGGTSRIRARGCPVSVRVFSPHT